MPFKLYLLCLGLVSFLLYGQAVAQTQASDEQPEIPPPLTEYMGRRIAPTMHYAHAGWLLRPERQQEEDCERLLKILEIQKGWSVCDLGCGNGFYTLRMAEAVGEEGVVYGVDVQSEMLRMLEERARQAELENVKPVHGTLIDPRLPEESLDLVLLVDVYHEFSHPEHMLRAIRQALKPSGCAVLVEFRGEDPNVPIRELHKMTKRQIMKEWPANGFQLAKSDDSLPWQHVLWFARDDVELEEKSAETRREKTGAR